MAATITPTIDGYRNGYTDHFSCFREYIVKGEPTTTQLPVRGRPYTQQANWPSLKYRVSDYQLEAIIRDQNDTASRVYRLHVTGSTRISRESATYPKGLKRNAVQKTMRQQTFRIAPEMVGAHRATKADIGFYAHPGDENQQYRGFTAQLSDDFKTPLPSGYGHDYAKEGDFVYDNAVSAKYYWNNPSTIKYELGPTRTADAGSARTWKGMPFKRKTDGMNPLTLKHVNMTLVCEAFTVTYWVQSNRHFYKNAPRPANDGIVSDWGPQNGRKYGPPVVGPPNTAGIWRAVGQDVAPDYEDSGQELLRITRTFLRLPEAIADSVIIVGPPAKLYVNVRWNDDLYGTWNGDWP